MKELVCIVCPNGCKMTVDEISHEVSGNKCKRGELFAVQELTKPMRTICSTVRTAFPDCPVLPCRVSAEIPKDLIFEVMKEINAVVVEKRLNRGDVIIKNVAGLNADVIATSGKLARIKEKN